MQNNTVASESDDRLRFITYSNYVAAIANFIELKYPHADDLCNAIVQSHGFATMQSGKCRDENKVEKLLRNAWFTEIQLNLASIYPDSIVYSNHWAPVQMYYVAYLSIRSFLIASGQGTRRDHTATLKTISEQIRVRHDLFPQPWTILCFGDPSDSPCEYSGLPDGVKPQTVSSLSSHQKVDFWNSYTMFLRTTRKRLIEKKCDEWKLQKKKKRVAPSIKKEFIKSQWPTSFFDALYRLRIRSNYEDADSFLLSLDMDTEAKELNESIRKIGWYSALLFELLTARCLGKMRFREIVHLFAKKDKEHRSLNLVAARWESIEKTWK